MPIPIHPFPARMAPEIALAALDDVRPGSVVLDPMCGSGTVVREAADRDCIAIGRDIDPLAVLMTQVWTTRITPESLVKACTSLLDYASSLDPAKVSLPWIDERPDVSNLIDFWFAEEQIRPLRQIASCLQSKRGPLARALRLGLSKIIITKWYGASRAGDTAHSRPHRVRETNDFDVFKGYEAAVRSIANSLESDPPRSDAIVRRGNATALRWPSPGTVDAVITSPPYGSAIDYLRGHKLSLVWLGYDLNELKSVRLAGVGTRGRPRLRQTQMGRIVTDLLGGTILSDHARASLTNFASDLFRVMSGMHRVLMVDGRAVVVVGANNINGVRVENERLVQIFAKVLGLNLLTLEQRAIPPNRRYLPPPESSAGSALSNRLSVETIATLVKST